MNVDNTMIIIFDLGLTKMGDLTLFISQDYLFYQSRLFGGKIQTLTCTEGMSKI